MDPAPLSFKLKALSEKDSLKLKASNRRPDAVWVRQKALYLATALHADSYLLFFYKVAWNLPEPQIDDILDRSRRKNPGNPLFYFIKCCKSEMRSK